MPLIYRITADIFEFADVVDLMVNPVNLVSTPGAGLALEFRKRAPGYVEPYREACKTQELRIGTVKIIEDLDQPWDMLLFPTKRHYIDTSSPEDITRGLEALQALLKQEKYRYSTIGMPMLGCGLGLQDYATVQPLMEQYLGGLDATVFLSMSPDRTEMRPKYLTIAGPLDYGLKEQEQSAIDWSIDKVMSVWGMDINDYTGIVSGGYPGVDAYVCGEHYLKDETNSYVFKKTGKPGLVVKPNTQRNGLGANLHLGNLLGEIGDDIILFKPVNHNNNRLSAMQSWLQVNKEQRERDGLHPKRIAIFGDKNTEQKTDDNLIPQIDDIPY